MSTKGQHRLRRRILMKKGPIHGITMVKNRELMVNDRIVRGKRLIAKVNVG